MMCDPAVRNLLTFFHFSMWISSISRHRRLGPKSFRFSPSPPPSRYGLNRGRPARLSFRLPAQCNNPRRVQLHLAINKHLMSCGIVARRDFAMLYAPWRHTKLVSVRVASRARALINLAAGARYGHEVTSGRLCLSERMVVIK
jgi:hypothetical protein